ncbi:MAG: ComF family protein [Clostridia bacterium]|nr:ComF family protein [Clostridia bacterium]
MNNFWKGLFFVRKCVVCGKALPDAGENTVFCADCFRNYRKLRADVCAHCGKTENACRCVPKKLWGKIGFSAHLFTFYGPLSRTIVYTAKLRNLPYLQRFLAHELSDLIREATRDDFSDFTVTFAPRNPRRVAVCGFDQAEVLARLTAERLHLPFARMFRHTYFSSLQKRLNAAEREINANNSYFLREDFVPQTKKLLIFDDVITTGSTLSTLVSLAKLAGFREVSIVCIAKASA